jgi:hypothetical protein
MPQLQGEMTLGQFTTITAKKATISATLVPPSEYDAPRGPLVVPVCLQADDSEECERNLPPRAVSARNDRERNEYQEIERPSYGDDLSNDFALAVPRYPLTKTADNIQKKIRCRSSIIVVLRIASPLICLDSIDL